jgi:hypothetical protein
VLLTAALVSGFTFASGRTALLAQTQTVEVRGTVVSTETQEPVPTPLVTVLGGRAMLGAPDGTFRLSNVSPGALRLRIEQIGFAALDTTVTAAAGAPLELRLALEPRAIPLEGLVIVAAPTTCTRPGFQAAATDEHLAHLLDEFRRNAERYQVLTESYPLELSYERTRRDIGRDGAVLRAQTDTLTQKTGSATRYQPGGVLTAERGKQPMMRLPSVADLASEAFEQAHCFRYAGLETLEGKRYHRIDFTPSEHLRSADVEGSMLLGTDDLLMHRSEFRLVNVPRGLPGVHTRSFQVGATYWEFRPGLVIPYSVRVAQELERVSMGRHPVAQSTEERLLVAHRFLAQAPDASGSLDETESESPR